MDINDETHAKSFHGAPHDESVNKRLRKRCESLQKRVLNLSMRPVRLNFLPYLSPNDVGEFPATFFTK